MLWTSPNIQKTCYPPLALPFQKVGPRGSSMFSMFGMVESMFSMFRHVQHVLFMFFVWNEVVHAINMHFTWFEHVLNMLNMLNMKNCNWTWQKKKLNFTVNCMFSMIRLCKHALNIPEHAQTWLNMKIRFLNMLLYKNLKNLLNTILHALNCSRHAFFMLLPLDPTFWKGRAKGQ